MFAPAAAMVVAVITGVAVAVTVGSPGVVVGCRET